MTMDADDRESLFFTAIAVVFIAGFTFVGFLYGLDTAKRRFQTEAVEHNAAHWETSADGSTTFVWNEVSQ